MFIPPNGSEEMAWIEVKSADVRPDALVVNEHTDYQCPYCGLADQIFGSSLRELAERGDIVLRLHIRTMVGDRIIQNDSSERATVASTCADVVGSFMAYHEAIFANQPAEGVGFTDQQLRVDFARQAGITGDALTTFQQCYDTRKTLPYVQAMEETNWTSTTINGSTQDPVHGTPAFFVNGTPMEFGAMLKRDGNTYVSGIDSSPDGLLAYMKSIAG